MRFLLKKYYIFLIIFFTFSLSLMHISAVSAQSFLTDLENLQEELAQQSFPNFTRAYQERVRIFDAWDEIKNSGVPLFHVDIGIIDTGVDARNGRHPEFQGVDLSGSTPLALRDRAVEFNPLLTGGHGTKVVGIIGANNISENSPVNYEFPHMNGIISGITDDYTLISKSSLLFNILTPAGFGGVIDNMEEGAIVNISHISRDHKAEDFDAFTEYWTQVFEGNSDKLFIIAAGNNDQNVTTLTPQNINTANTIIVGAVDLNDNRSSFSNFGIGVDIAAPGEEIYAPSIREKGDFPEAGTSMGNYSKASAGTSFSAPMVTGVAGLIKAIKPNLTPAEIKTILIETADDIITDKPIGGRLNAFKAVCDEDVLDCDGAPPLPPSPPLSCPLSSTLASDGTIPLSESPCVVQDNLTIPSGVTLTVDPGVIIKISTAGASKRILVNGTLNANGTAAEPIFFTSIGDDSLGGDTNGDGPTPPGRWLFIQVQPGGEAHFTHSTIRLGGRDVTGEPPRPGIRISGGVLTLEDSRVTDNDEINIQILGGTTTLTNTDVDAADRGISFISDTATLFVNNSDIYNNRFEGIKVMGRGTFTLNNSDFQSNGSAMIISPAINFTHNNNTATNNSINGIVMSGDTVADRIWTKDLIPYVLSVPATSSVRVLTGTKLTIDPGVIVKFARDNSSLTIFGEVEARGTALEPIFFTSILDDAVDGQDTGNDGTTLPVPSSWRRILLSHGSTAKFLHTTIQYAGTRFTFQLQGGLVNLGGTLTLTDSHLTQNFNMNLNHINGTTTITNSEVDTSRTSILQTLGTVTVSGSSIHNNTFLAPLR